jgi:hypothetical protein
MLRVLQEGTITQEAIEMHNVHGDSRFLWEELTAFGERVNLLVLFKGPTFAIPFPKSFFTTDDDWNVLLTFVRNNLPPYQVTRREKKPLSRAVIVILLMIMVCVVTVLVMQFAAPY